MELFPKSTGPNSPPRSPARLKKIKEKLDAWLKELKYDRDTNRTEMGTLRDENKTLQQESIQLRTGQMKKLSEMVSRGEGSLSKRVRETLSRLDTENVQFHDRLQLLGISDTVLKEERRRLEELAESIRAHEEKLRKKEKLLHDRVNETSSLDEQLKIITAEMGRIQDDIRHFEKVELAERELRSSGIDRNILNQESLNKSMIEKVDLAERRIKAMRDEKQRILDSITRMDEIELPQHEARSKEALSKVEQSRSELQRCEGFLSEREQEVSIEKDRMEKLREKAMSLKMQHQKAEAEQKRLSGVLSRLDDDVDQKKARCDELRKTASQLELEICAQNEALEKMRESCDLLTGKIPQQETLQKKRAGESASLETKVQVDTIKKQELIKAVNHLGVVELPLRQAELRSVENGIAEQEALLGKLEKERLAIEAHIQAKAAEKQEMHDAIKRIEEVELPLRGSELKETRSKIERMQAELQNLQNSLVGMDREVYSESDELMKLHWKNTTLKEQCQETQSEQRRLDVVLTHLGADITQKMSRRDELARKRMRLESEIGMGKEMLMNAVEAVKSLGGKIRRQSGIMKEVDYTYFNERMMLVWRFFIGKRKTFFWISLLALAVVLVAFTIRRTLF